MHWGRRLHHWHSAVHAGSTDSPNPAHEARVRARGRDGRDRSNHKLPGRAGILIIKIAAIKIQLMCPGVSTWNLARVCECAYAHSVGGTADHTTAGAVDRLPLAVYEPDGHRSAPPGRPRGPRVARRLSRASSGAGSDTRAVKHVAAGRQTGRRRWRGTQLCAQWRQRAPVVVASRAAQAVRMLAGRGAADRDVACAGDSN